MQNFIIEPIAYIHNNFKEKFGIPRQSGISNCGLSTIVFAQKFQDENAVRGLEGFSHLWLLWMFDDKNADKTWAPTVRPPRLGGNKRMGVFATRSPYHPNGIGLSCVKIESIEKNVKDGIIIKVSGADILDGTPIIDIKPYLTFTDSHPEALNGFAENSLNYELDVEFSCDTYNLDNGLIEELSSILRLDPRPSYQDDCEKIYSMRYAEYDVKFTVNNNVLTVVDIIYMNGCEK